MIYGNKISPEREERRLRESTIAESDKKLIRSFVTEKVASAGIGKHRITKYMQVLRLTAERHLDTQNYDDLTKPDVIRIIVDLERSGMSDWTKHDYKLMLKIFLGWLGKDVSWIRVKNPRSDLRPEDMLTLDDVQRLIDAAISLRDKALISMLYEGGFRIGEIAGLRIKDVTFDRFGAVVIVRGKIGMRRVRLISSFPMLSQWLEAHPLREDREAPLWVYAKNRTMMRYAAIRAQLRKIARRAGIQKRVNPHNFRHSRATYLASHLTESQLEQYLGWVHGSSSPRTYVHLSGRDIDEDLLRLHGLIEESGEDKERAIVQCPFCRTINSVSARICVNCRKPLVAEEVIGEEERMVEFMERLLQLSVEHPSIAEAMKKFFERA